MFLSQIKRIGQTFIICKSIIFISHIFSFFLPCSFLFRSLYVCIWSLYLLLLMAFSHVTTFVIIFLMLGMYFSFCRVCPGWLRLGYLKQMQNNGVGALDVWNVAIVSVYTRFRFENLLRPFQVKSWLNWEIILTAKNLSNLIS